METNKENDGQQAACRCSELSKTMLLQQVANGKDEHKTAIQRIDCISHPANRAFCNRGSNMLFIADELHVKNKTMMALTIRALKRGRGGGRGSGRRG